MASVNRGNQRLTVVVAGVMRHWLRFRASNDTADEAAWVPIAALFAAYEEPVRAVDPFVAVGPALAREAARRRAATTAPRASWFRLVPLTAAIALLIGAGVDPLASPAVRTAAPADAETGVPVSGPSVFPSDAMVAPTASVLPLGPEVATTPCPALNNTQPHDLASMPPCSFEPVIGPR